MTPLMYERVRSIFTVAGLTDGFIVQLLRYSDPGDSTKPVMVFRPNGGSPIREDIASDYYVLVDVIGAKGRNEEITTSVQKITDWVQANGLSDDCIGYIENVNGIPTPIDTQEGRMAFRLLFVCKYGD